MSLIAVNEMAWAVFRIAMLVCADLAVMFRPNALSREIISVGGSDTRSAS